jgi:hypothetical protein
MANNIVKTLKGASFLLVLLGALILLYAQTITTSTLFPQDVEFWNMILTVYLVVFALTLIGGIIYAPEVIRQLSRANYWKNLIFRFVPSAGITLFVLLLLKIFIKSSDLNIFTAIAYMPISVLLVHLFVVSQIEEIQWGILYRIIAKNNGEKPAKFFSIITFGLWHFAKTGGSLIAMSIYIPLRYYWDYVRENGTPWLNKVSPKFFGATPYTNQGNAGSHFSLNVFMIGMENAF